LQQSESFMLIKRFSSSLYIFWAKKQDFVDDKHLKTLKQIDRKNAKNERQSFKTWFETLSKMQEHEMKMRMKNNFVNVLNRMISIKINLDVKINININIVLFMISICLLIFICIFIFFIIIIIFVWIFNSLFFIRIFIFFSLFLFFIFIFVSTIIF
jgi:cellulose synthase/poly-beta-1,6-N-acetylglucosamine synthase-like glycosyltransferase